MATALNARQRYALTQARDYGNFGAVAGTTANSLFRRGLVVAMNRHRTSWHVQLTPEGWALLTDREQDVTVVRAHEAAEAEAATRQAGA
jgi:hypothetical protein